MVYIFIFFRALSLCLLGAAIGAGIIHTVKHIRRYHDIDAISYLMFEHTSRDDRTYTEEELACPYFDNCYIQVRNQGACRFMCKDNPAYNKEKSK